jgi:hypothetical protein
VKIKIGEFISREKAYFDSGNTLQDPLFGVAVAVADHSLWTDISRGGALKMERFCLVPYESVGGRGVLQGVRCDYIEVSGKITKGCIIARGEKDAFFGLGDDECRLLLSRDMEPGGE